MVLGDNMSVVCIRHPKYVDGSTPDLNCKTCCRRYVDNVLARQASLSKNEFNTQKWLEGKINGRLENDNSPNPGRRPY